MIPHYNIILQYLKSIVELFEKYKEAAGYPDASLEIL